MRGVLQDTQGLAFIMVVSALIYQEMELAVANISEKSVGTCLLEARMVKADKRHGNRIACNCLKKQIELFKQLNTPWRRLHRYITKNPKRYD